MSLFQTAKDKNYERLVAENSFINDVQVAVEAALNAKDMSQAELAKRLGISPARVSQILGGNGANLEARTIARVAHALGMQAMIEFVDAHADDCETASKAEYK